MLCRVKQLNTYNDALVLTEEFMYLISFIFLLLNPPKMPCHKFLHFFPKETES